MELSEDELIAAISRLVSDLEEGVVVGPGDDAAVLRPGSGELVLTTDLLVEGIHFERASISARDLGAKAITVNVSDVAAMGGSPRAAVAAVGLPGDLDAAWAIELTGGMRDACAEYALALVGGDTNRSGSVIVSVAVVGEVAPGRAVTRSGARPGDEVVVTGALGAAAAGLRLTRADARTASSVLSEPWGRGLADARARPVARGGEGQTLAQAGASAMIDLSDGLAKDLTRLCRASGVGARIDLGAVPIAASVRAAAAALDLDPLAAALGGGEDYELLAVLPPEAVERATGELRERFGVTLTAVGTIIEGADVLARDADGREHVLEPTGWDHFA
jgi:thiamine-monophosphate kinase